MSPQAERINPNKGGGVISADLKLKLLAFFAAHAPPKKLYEFKPGKDGDPRNFYEALSMSDPDWRLWCAQKQLEAFEEMDRLLEPAP